MWSIGIQYFWAPNHAAVWIIEAATGADGCFLWNTLKKYPYNWTCLGLKFTHGGVRTFFFFSFIEGLGRLLNTFSKLCGSFSLTCRPKAARPSLCKATESPHATPHRAPLPFTAWQEEGKVEQWRAKGGTAQNEMRLRQQLEQHGVEHRGAGRDAERG